MPIVNINGKNVEVPTSVLRLPAKEKDAYYDDIAKDMIMKSGAEQQANQQQINQDVLNYGRYLEKQDSINNNANNSSILDFALSAGIGIDKFARGVSDLIGVGGDNQEHSRRLKMLDETISEQSPIANFTGRMTGGALAAIPTTVAATMVAPEVAGGFVTRAGLSTLAGAAEGALELPFAEESRFGNTIAGAASGFASEPVSMALGRALKGINYTGGALYDAAAGASNKVKDTATDIFAGFGIKYDSLKPSTRKILETVSHADDVDVAIRNAIETEQGFQLTAGEASQNFAQLSAEGNAARQSSSAGDMMRDFKDRQNADIITASEEIVRSAGGAVHSKETAGAVVKKALVDARGADKKSYQGMYNDAAKMAEADGVDIPLEKDVVAEVFETIAQQHRAQHGPMLNDIGRELARLGVLDTDRFNVDTPFKLIDAEPGQLSVANAEQFIKFLNSKHSTDQGANRLLALFKKSVGENADKVIAKTIDTVDKKTAKEFLEKARQARSAAGQYRSLWDAKDVMSDITGNKKGTDTAIKTASDIVKRVTAKPEDARQVIAALEKSGNKAAIADLRTFVLKDMFDKSINADDMFSGRKLTTFVKSNTDVLQSVLTPDQFLKLKSFEQAVGKATKKPAGAINYSDTANKIADFIWGSLSHVPFNPMGAARDFGAQQTIKDALKSAPETVDYLLKFDKNHVKLNALLRQVVDQSLFESQATLSESEYLD